MTIGGAIKDNMKNLLDLENRNKENTVRENSMHKAGFVQKSGNVNLLCTVQGKTLKVGVTLTVYGGTTSYEHYAIVSQQSKFTNNSGYINLKQCTVERLDNCKCSFRVIPKDGDGNILTFSAKSSEEIDSWLDVMVRNKTQGLKTTRTVLGALNRKVPCSLTVRESPCMPTLCEEEED